jgi:plasmid stabilization system protein ParE
MISKRSVCSLLGILHNWRRRSPTESSATDKLESFPRSGRIVPELGIENIREILVGSYRIIYRIRYDDVHLLTVHHGARLLDTTKIGAGD